MGGGDKPMLVLAGRTMLERILSVVALDHMNIAISANGDPARFATALPVLPDPFPNQGPLAGVLAGMEWAATLGASAVLTVPGDTPLIPAGLANTLAPAPSVAESAGRVHHLVALWPVSAARSLRSFLSTPGSRSVRAFADTLGMRRIRFAGEPFVNINTPAELAEMDARLHTGT